MADKQEHSLMSRRDAGKVVGIMALSALFAGKKEISLAIRDLVRGEEPHINLENVNSDSRHVLYPSMINKQTSLILGELDYGDVMIYYADPDTISVDANILSVPEEELKLESNEYHANEGHGIGEASRVMMLHTALVNQLRKNNIEIAQTDRPNGLDAKMLRSYLETYEEAWSTKYWVSTLSSLGLGVVVAEKLKMSPLSQVLTSSSIGASSIVEAVKPLPDATLAKYKDELSGELFESVVVSRNLNMVHNTRSIVSLVMQNKPLYDYLGFDKGKEIMLFAGAGHERLRDLLTQTTEQIEHKIVSQADQDINLGIIFMSGSKKYSEAEGRPEISSPDDLMKLWLGLVDSYGYPIATFFDSPEYQKVSKYDLPDSPRLILWRRLIRKAVEGTESANGAIRFLIMNLADNDLRSFDPESLNTPPKTIMYKRMVDRYKAGELETFDLSVVTSYFNDQGKDVRLVVFEGVPFVVDVNKF